ncbi:hypothetical protein BDV25DRAFT_170340 [Aspergillus avenaceus]|uniref:FAD/NAD(P)-binding domain-containing protein n=1 Tax=Aspergillus avenaceus TaxID=36643 RepID=A0A5N6U8T6_ASPAV|nr:hypothetical protein BDV25DRAFT_170340 [Aspergillus avenaceus]
MGSIGPQEQDYDVLIVGAGLSGIYSLYNIRKQIPSWRVKVIEAAESVGGTWLWNCYPGARFDSETISYQFSWDKELLQEWNWKDTFSAQPDTLKYIERVCEKHNLYDGIQFNTRVKSAHWQDTDCTWLFIDENSFRYRTRFFVSCMGVLSCPTLPAIPGIKTFEGQAFHTSRWPKDFDMKRDFANKRIGVIGTGATGIQTITETSKEPSIQSLTVFQRTPNWSAPLRNTKITPGQMEKIKMEYDAIFRRCASTPTGFLHQPDPRKTHEVPPEERVELWEKCYAEPGFAKWLGVFSDTYTDREANKLYSDFMADKIRQRVHDPAVADSLIPKNHGFGTRRVPLESGYFEAFNQSNVHLVDLQKTPVETVTPKGILTSDGKEHELDILVYATGFDAITGAFNPIEWHGKDDRPLIGSSDTELGKRAVWLDHRPYTYLGLMIPSFPNMFTVLGPHQPFGNIPRSIENAVQVVTQLLEFCKQENYTFVEATAEAADKWTEHVVECSKGALSNEIDSWMTGVNTNVPGKRVRSVARYGGSAVEYRKRCQQCRAAGWEGFHFA